MPVIPRPLLNINCPGTVSEIFLSCQLEACSCAAEWGQVLHAGRHGSASPLECSTSMDGS